MYAEDSNCQLQASQETKKSQRKREEKNPKTDPPCESQRLHPNNENHLQSLIVPKEQRNKPIGN